MATQINPRYTFGTKKIYDLLNNGLYRIYYDEVISSQEVEHIELDEDGNPVQTGVMYTVTTYTYSAVDIPTLDKNVCISAMIRKRYSQDEEFALLRQRDITYLWSSLQEINSEGPTDNESSITDFKEYYNYAEECKAKAKAIFAQIENV